MTTYCLTAQVNIFSDAYLSQYKVEGLPISLCAEVLGVAWFVRQWRALMDYDICSFDKWLLFLGQIELYTHLPIMRQLVEQLQQWEFRVCGVFLVDSQFMVESFKVTVTLIHLFPKHTSMQHWSAPTLVLTGNLKSSLIFNCSSSQESWLPWVPWWH